MNALSQKKLILAGILVLLVLPFIPRPALAAYGTDFDTAQIITEGTYNETLSSTDTNAYYKVYCFTGTIFNVTISYNGSLGHYLWLITYDPKHYFISQSNMPEDVKNLTVTCERNGYFFIQVHRYSSGDIPFELTFDYIYRAFIPGFEMAFLLYSLVMILGFAIIFRKTHKPTYSF
jgi:hypothetical protein